mgnify:CR=1 FL=1
MKLSRNQKIILAIALAFALTVPTFAMIAPYTKAQGNVTYIIPLEDYMKNDDIAAIRLVNTLLEENVTVKWAMEPFTVGGTTYPAGTMYIETPFTTRNGISSDVIMEWFMWAAKTNRVLRIDRTTETVTANASDLVTPRVVLFYDTSTYDNAINHYERFLSLGFKVKLATADTFLGLWWNDTAFPLYDANVFIMPGGALHLFSFGWGATAIWAIQNISEWVYNGGGYVSVCAGSSEALNKTPYTAFKMIDADYYREWFDDTLSPAGYGANEWKALIGPILIEVEQPNHPVMFGYGPNAVRPGYGPEVPLYYYGGPAYTDIGNNITILANYSAPISQNIDAAGRTNSIWGEPAIIAAQYGNGRLVAFGPHPEWPGPGARLHAQAVFWVAQHKIDASHLDPATTLYNPSEITFDRLNSILAVIDNITPYLESFARISTTMVNLRGGDHYNPAGMWFDEVCMYYGLKFAEHLNALKRDAVKFQYEYYKLSLLRSSVSVETRAVVDYALALIDSFFNYSEAFPVDTHYIGDSDWTGNVFAPYIGDAADFAALYDLFVFIENETRELIYPSALNYTRDYYRVYNEILALNRTTPSLIPDNATLARWGFNLTAHAGSNVTTLLIDFYANITSSWPAGPMYKMYYMFYHTLDICQFKIDRYLLDMMTIGDRIRDVTSYLDYTVAMEVGAWAYAAAEWQAAIYQPAGAFT